MTIKITQEREKCSGTRNRQTQTKIRVPIGGIKRVLHLIGWQDELNLRHAKYHRDPVILHV